MVLRRLDRARCRALVLFHLASAAACTGAQSASWRPAPPPPATVITSEAIAASGARTAWDALRLTVPNVHLREDRGRAVAIRRRGRTSVYLNDGVRVVLDNARIYDLQVLQEIAATDIRTIAVYTGLDGTTYYGTGSTAGVLVITTTIGVP